MQKVISLELNELNFEFIQQYVAMGKLPGFAKLLDRHELVETVSESGYPYLEPWIQWPTVYTGKAFDEHKVFRLGDIVGSGHGQIWETLEARGVSVGAVSPMNAENRCDHADFFVPDPWTVTSVTGDKSLQELAGLVSAAVNGNATGGDGLGTAELGRRLLPFLFKYGMTSSLGSYMRILWSAKKYKWAKAAFLDRFLTDVFLRLRAQKGTQFASLFLNAGAHIQHHHMFEAAIYDGEQRNPSWYSTAKDDGVDPLLFIYSVYDGVLSELMELPDTRLLVSTGLSQKANARTIYQYRFNGHAASLAQLGVTDGEVVPRMSRDFLVNFPDAGATKAAAARLGAITCQGEPLFTIEERDTSLFCQIGYFGPKDGLAQVIVDGRTIDLSEQVSLVSIENGIHRTIGYFVDTAVPRPTGAAGTALRQMPLPQVFEHLLACFPKAGVRAVGAAAPVREEVAA